MKNSIVAPPAEQSCLTELRFPFTPPQVHAELQDLAPGVKWLRLPMPYALDHVNVYLLQAGNGWLIVDTGLDSPGTRKIWEEVFSGPLRGETIVGIFCTHYHVDHVGLAGYLTDRWSVPLYMSYEEYFSLRGWPTNLQEVPWQHARFFQKAGFPKELLPETLVMFDFSKYISPPPASFIRLQDGKPLSIAGGDWQIIMGQGHAPEHAMLYSAQQGILFSGDQLLPKISTNVSVSVVTPEDEPLSRWLASLDRLAEIPDDVLVLPGHGLPFHGAKLRSGELRDHHEAKFQVITEACAVKQLSAYELVQIFYPHGLRQFDLQLALGECLAHVHYLRATGRLEERLDDHGTNRYGSISPSAEETSESSSP